MSVNGGISFFLCTNAGNGPAGTQLCPAGPAELTGVITPDLVIGPAGTPGIEAGAFAEIAAAIRTARPTPTSTRRSGRAAKSAASCVKQGGFGFRPVPRKGAGRGLPYIFDQKLSHGTKVSCTVAGGLQFFVDTVVSVRRNPKAFAIQQTGLGLSSVQYSCE